MSPSSSHSSGASVGVDCPELADISGLALLPAGIRQLLLSSWPLDGYLLYAVHRLLPSGSAIVCNTLN